MSLGLAIVVIVVLALAVVAVFALFVWAAIQDGRAAGAGSPASRPWFRRRG